MIMIDTYYIMRDGRHDYDYTMSKRANGSNDNINALRDREIDNTHLFAQRGFWDEQERIL